MGHEIKVHHLPADKWPKDMEDAVGYFDPQRMEIGICQLESVSSQEQSFWHEATHAMLYVLGSPDYGNEQFVDQMGGLIQQIIQSSRFT